MFIKKVCKFNNLTLYYQIRFCASTFAIQITKIFMIDFEILIVSEV